MRNRERGLSVGGVDVVPVREFVAAAGVHRKRAVEWTSLQTGVTTTGNKLALFGDFDGYTVVDRIGTTVEVIPHLFGSANRFPKGQRGLVMWWRMGAGVTKANALRYLEVK